MKTITNITKVALSYDELMSVNCIPSNRCGYLTKEDALANGFSETDYGKFVKRAEKIKKMILKKGFSKASFFILAKDKEGKLYLLDGQGRRKALHLMSSSKEMNKLEFVCDLYTEPMSFEDMTKLIIDLNSGNTNWGNKDIRRSNALASNDEEVVTAYNYTKKMADDYEIRDYMINLLTYGEKASHARSNSGDVFSTKDYVESKDVFTNAYLKFVVNASCTYDRNGNIIERTKKAKDAIRNVNLGIAIVGAFRDIVNSHNHNIEESVEDIDYLVDALLKYCDGDDNYLVSKLKCSTNKKEEFWDKVKSRIRKASIINAYKNSCAYASA